MLCQNAGARCSLSLPQHCRSCAEARTVSLAAVTCRTAGLWSISACYAVSCLIALYSCIVHGTLCMEGHTSVAESFSHTLLVSGQEGMHQLVVGLQYWCYICMTKQTPYSVHHTFSHMLLDIGLHGGSSSVRYPSSALHVCLGTALTCNMSYATVLQLLVYRAGRNTGSRYCLTRGAAHRA